MWIDGMFANTCASSQSFDIAIGVGDDWQLNPNNNARNATFTYNTSGEIDPSTFNLTLFGTGTKQGETLCLSNVTGRAKRYIPGDGTRANRQRDSGHQPGQLQLDYEGWHLQLLGHNVYGRFRVQRACAWECDTVQSGNILSELHGSVSRLTSRESYCCGRGDPSAVSFFRVSGRLQFSSGTANSHSPVAVVKRLAAILPIRSHVATT
ncbi:MAG TPA: hypothetical protein VJU82_01335 [Acidobacteriaceae bacterium]|nr:hypothetical protein [Acidobacteriaceae bacterium]